MLRAVTQTVVKRSALAAAVAFLGVGWCLANDYYWNGQYNPLNVVGDLTIAFPFYVLSIAAALGWPRRVGTALTLVGLGLLASVAYQVDATSTSSTAGLVFLLPLVYGTALVVVAVLVQVLVDALRSRHTREFVQHLNSAEQEDWATFISGQGER
jgi:peptidoglycan/LPS O-acetylase OafA/YrhL